MVVAQQRGNYAFIDGINLHLTYENLDWKLDYRKLRIYLEKRHGVKIAYYFLGLVRSNWRIYEDLEAYGYELEFRDISRKTTAEEGCPYCGKCIKPEQIKIKCDCDADLTLKVMVDIGNYDKAIIITSDGDFDNLVRRLIHLDKLKLVLAPCKEGCSKLLKDASLGRISFLDEFKDELKKLER